MDDEGENEAQKMKFPSEDLEEEIIIKSELTEYDSVEESYFTEAQIELMNLINGDIHDLPEHETDSLQTPAIKLESLHRCYQCQEEFQTSESLRYHIGTYTKNNIIMPHVKGSNVISKSCDVQLKVHTPNESQDKSPQNKNNDLALNKLLDTKEETFVCKVCCRPFKTMSSLILHNKKKHQLVGRFCKCENCGKRFKTSSLLKIHMRVHSKEKMFNCDICNKDIKYWQSLKMHVQAHMEGGKPYKCSICSRDFSKQYYLNKHMLKHVGDKKFKCKVCKQAFSRNDVLKSHMLVHRGEKCFVCDVCNKDFTKLTYLKEHKKIHMDKKPYVCNVCGKGFIYAFYLNTHLRTHSGEKPFECDICQKRFARRFSVTKHKRIHTKVRKIKKPADRKTRKSADRKNRKQKSASDNDSNNTSLHEKEETVISFVDQDNEEIFIESSTASKNSILFSVENELYIDLSSEIEFSDVKIKIDVGN